MSLLLCSAQGCTSLSVRLCCDSRRSSSASHCHSCCCVDGCSCRARCSGCAASRSHSLDVSAQSHKRTASALMISISAAGGSCAWVTALHCCSGVCRIRASGGLCDDCARKCVDRGILHHERRAHHVWRYCEWPLHAIHRRHSSSVSSASQWQRRFLIIVACAPHCVVLRCTAVTRLESRCARSFGLTTHVVKNGSRAAEMRDRSSHPTSTRQVAAATCDSAQVRLYDGLQ